VGILARHLSEFSFTLYVLHVPVIQLLQHVGRTWFGREKLDPSSAADFAVYFAILGILLAASYLCYLLFERNTYRVRRFVKRLLLPASTKPARPVIFSAD
jgi:peptidoglycan/LPS O-acetylase OafA/YrhL